MKSVSFFLEQFQRYGLLKNVQRFGATLYDCNTRPFITPVKDINANTQKKKKEHHIVQWSVVLVT